MRTEILLIFVHGIYAMLSCTRDDNQVLHLRVPLSLDAGALRVLRVILSVSFVM